MKSILLIQIFFIFFKIIHTTKIYSEIDEMKLQFKENLIKKLCPSSIKNLSLKDNSEDKTLLNKAIENFDLRNNELIHFCDNLWTKACENPAFLRAVNEKVIMYDLKNSDIIFEIWKYNMICTSYRTILDVTTNLKLVLEFVEDFTEATYNIFIMIMKFKENAILPRNVNLIDFISQLGAEIGDSLLNENRVNKYGLLLPYYHCTLVQYYLMRAFPEYDEPSLFEQLKENSIKKIQDTIQFAADIFKNVTGTRN